MWSLIACLVLLMCSVSNGQGDGGLRFFNTDPDGGVLQRSQSVAFTWDFNVRTCPPEVIDFCPIPPSTETNCVQLLAGNSPAKYVWKATYIAVAGRFRLRYNSMVNQCGTVFTAYSNNFTMNFCESPSLLREPKSDWVALGSPAQFIVNATGTLLTYQWQFNGSPIDGATNSVYRINSVTKQDEGYYTAIIKDKCGTIMKSRLANLGICPELVIKNFSPLVQATVGTKVVVSIDAYVASGNLHYYWYREYSDKFLSLTSQLTFEKFSAGDYGRYVVVVQTSCYPISVNRTVLISDKPFMIIQNPPGTLSMFRGDTATIGVTLLKGDFAVAYQWYKGSAVISGANEANYTTPAFSLSDNGASYTVSVSYGGFTATSTPCIVVVQPAPVINSTAASGPVFLNQTATYSVTAMGERIQYEWMVNGVVQQSFSGLTAVQIVASSFLLNASQIIANVSNPNGFATSKPFLLVIKPKPAFTVTSFPDVFLFRKEHYTINMTGLVYGESMSFVWLQDGQIVTGSGNSLDVLMDNNLDVSNYQLQASNPSGVTLSPAVNVLPEPAPKITGHSPYINWFFVGDVPTLYVNATGRAVQYRWFQNSRPIDNQVTSEIRLWPLDESDNGAVFQGEAYNVNYGSSVNFTLSLEPAPAIFQQLPDTPQVSFFAGQTLLFSVNASGHRLEFDWDTSPGLNFTVDTASQWSVLSVINATDEFFVMPRVINPSGTVIGRNISAQFSAAPRLTQFPAQTLVVDGKSATFQALAQNHQGAESIDFMWYVNGKLQDTNNASTLVLPLISTQYNSSIVKVVAINPVGSDSTSTELFVITKPRLDKPLKPLYEALSDSSLNITVDAVGYDITFEWRRHNEWFMNTTSGQLWIAKTKNEDSGIYQLYLHNVAGTAGPYQFQISVAAIAVKTPQDSTMEVFAGDSMTLSVTVNTQLNSSSFVIAWFINETLITGVSGTKLEVANVTSQFNGQYSIVISYATSQLRTFVANVKLLGAPVLQQPLQALDVKSGQTATITAVGFPELRLTYQWYKNGELMAKEVGKTLQFVATLDMQGNRYSVLLKNPAGETRSDEVELTVKLSDIELALVIGLVGIVSVLIVAGVVVLVRRKINQKRHVSFVKATYGVDEPRYPLLKPWTPPEDSKLCRTDKLPFMVWKTTVDFGEAGAVNVGEEYVDSVAMQWRGGLKSALASFKINNRSNNNNINEAVPLMNFNNYNPCVIVFHPPVSSKCELTVEPQQLILDCKRLAKKPKNIGEYDGDKTVQFKLKMNVTANISALIGVEVPQLNKYFYLSCEISANPSVWIDVDEIEKESAPIGEGGFGVVYRGTYRSEDVAVKMLRAQEFVDAKTLEEFDREIHLLSTLKYEGIVPFVGASNLPGKLAIVTRFMPNGSLEKWMQKKIPYGTKLRIALEIAKAIQFLHNNNVLHRDIKPENVLIESTDVNSPLLIRLTDFGSARQIYEDKIESFTKNVGTPIYMAPEILKTKRYDKAADIYSFGVLLWVLVTQQEPYSAFNHIWDVTKFVLDGNREAIPAGCPADYADLIVGCWHQDPTQRHSMQFVIEKLDAMYEAEFKLN